MGILDALFAGTNGLSAMLHQTLGGTALVKIAASRLNKEERTVETFFRSHNVPFVPGANPNEKVELGAPGASRSDVREPAATLSGTIPVASIDGDLRPERDLIQYQGIDYRITRVETLSVGDAPVQYSITATRL